ncbi:zinc-binding alcohol dehydrogenase family protein [Agromyces tardus]|jgi:propanol-preferring alcohol dehydrogenase|uniref:alcohol dehydrogenase n=2 Tax=Agromyces tardus TaxID=2583849 RepID=A0A3M8AJL4_9MICO|nr:zinc-dependent alcohol dehydrogenase family protein [Agromyces tardus]RNB51323.1 zinc-binding alcohol dehydrogenase family protein [Agromyces tardus]
MSAWTTRGDGRLDAARVPTPEPGAGELLVEVLACGVCRTDLHVIDGELERHASPVVPGHQVVGRVTAVGPGVARTRVGDLVGIAWLRSTCGACPWCRSGRENLCPDARFTGWDADGGYADVAVVAEAFAYPLPADTDPVAVAPLLCAGIIGYRALSRANLPAGGRLGLYGFGSSAHLTALLAMAQGASVSAMTRGEGNRALARQLGADFVGDEHGVPPVEHDAAIVFAPAGELVPLALASTVQGGTVVLAGIHMSDIPAMTYDAHLFRERDLRTVTANTRADGDAFLRLARALSISPEVTRYPFERADEAVDALRSGAASGSLVLTREG